MCEPVGVINSVIMVGYFLLMISFLISTIIDIRWEKKVFGYQLELAKQLKELKEEEEKE